MEQPVVRLCGSDMILSMSHGWSYPSGRMQTERGQSLGRPKILWFTVSNTADRSRNMRTEERVESFFHSKEDHLS